MTAVLVAPFIFLLAAVSLNCVQRLTEWIASLAKVCAYEITRHHTTSHYITSLYIHT
jgi:hypothetical protein